MPNNLYNPFKQNNKQLRHLYCCIFQKTTQVAHKAMYCQFYLILRTNKE